MASRIEDYAMIGDCRSAALVGRDGSIDWLCWPRFDSAACFAALLGTEEHGRWQIAPVGETKSRRHYHDGALILETVFETPEGTASVIDFMPIGEVHPSVVRLVIGRRGTVVMRTDLAIRFDYGITLPWVSRVDATTLTMVAGPSQTVLHTSVEINAEDNRSTGEFTVAEGETHSFTLSYGASYLPLPAAFDPLEALRRTETFWNEWSGRCADAGPWTEIVRRSLITLKGLSYLPTGGIVAAPTTSLPEQLGGQRNWDYRYCWLRDATFTLLAFMNAGYQDEARVWRDWLLRAIAGSPAQLQIMYGVGGERRLDEWEIPWLPGYEQSGPVRVGNAAAQQLQLDIYGELADAMAHAARGGLAQVPRGDALRRTLLEHLEQIWTEPDEGIWEIRGTAQHFTHSKVMAWVAFDRASRLEPLSAYRARWQTLADRIHDDVCRNGVDPERGCFVQAYGSRHLDASLLMLTTVGFLPAQDPRIVATVKAIEEDLLVDGLVQRYHTRHGVDGLPPGEGAFLACSFWLADNYILQGRMEDAKRLFERLVGLANDVGLLAEEYEPRLGRQLGNFPQAFSHVALVNTALSFVRAEQQRAAPRSLPARRPPRPFRAALPAADR
jgi:GH15 family glucan-1,4-alpha-glucosidase